MLRVHRVRSSDVAAQTFRAGVVAVVAGGDGRVLAFERSDHPDAWQFPQGGIDPDEEPIDAVWRELFEETGLGRDHVDLVAAPLAWFAYEVPAASRRSKFGRGQVQRWFLFRLNDDSIEPTPDGREFVAWKWWSTQDLIDHVAEFRRGVYSAGLAAVFAAEAGAAQRR
jgi:putative (di)nucleoside polyphosphate hydrolase